MKLFIKNMVCPRCIMSVEQILKQNGLSHSPVRLGEVDLSEPPTTDQISNLSNDLSAVGFELLDDQRTQQIDKIKTLLTETVQRGNIEDHFSIAKFLTAEIHKDYSHLSKLFSQVEGVTIEQFFILQKIEKAKEWIIYNELSLNEISFKLGYSSVQHLSTQFKKITGMTPSQFKQNGRSFRKTLDNIQGKDL